MMVNLGRGKNHQEKVEIKKETKILFTALGLYLLLKLLFARHCGGSVWMDKYYFITEPLIFSLLFYVAKRKYIIFSIPFFISVCDFIRQFSIAFNFIKYDYSKKIMIVDYAFFFGVIYVLYKYYGTNIIRKIHKFFICINNGLDMVKRFWPRNR